jgi:hypothetical protein
MVLQYHSNWCYNINLWFIGDSVVLENHSNWCYNINRWINGTTISVLILQYQSIIVLRYYSHMVTKTILIKGIWCYDHS